MSRVCVCVCVCVCCEIWASQVVLVVKNLSANAGDVRRGFDPWIGRIPWRRAWQPTLVFLPGESPWTEEPVAQVGYSLWGHKESKTTERLSTAHGDNILKIEDC